MSSDQMAISHGTNTKAMGRVIVREPRAGILIPGTQSGTAGKAIPMFLAAGPGESVSSDQMAISHGINTKAMGRVTVREPRAGILIPGTQSGTAGKAIPM